MRYREMVRTQRLLEDAGVQKAIKGAIFKAQVEERDFDDVVQEAKFALLTDSTFLRAKVPAAYARTVARNKAVDHIRRRADSGEILSVDMRLPKVNNGDEDDPEMMYACDLQHDGQYYVHHMRQDNQIQRSLPRQDFEWLRLYAERKRQPKNKFTDATKKKFQRLKDKYQLELFVREMPAIEHSKGIVAGSSIGPENIYDAPIPFPEWPIGEPSQSKSKEAIYGSVVELLLAEDYWQNSRPTRTVDKGDHKRKFIKRGAGTLHAVIQLRATVREQDGVTDIGPRYSLNQPAGNITTERTHRSRRSDQKTASRSWKLDKPWAGKERKVLLQVPCCRWWTACSKTTRATWDEEGYLSSPFDC